MRRKSGLAKSEKLTLRFTEYQAESIEAAAKQANMSRTAYLEAIVSNIHPLRQASPELEAYQLWFLMSSRWSRQRNAIRGLAARLFSGKFMPEGMKIITRLGDLAEEAIELVDELQSVTIDRK
jgi:hypothetical protein